MEKKKFFIQVKIQTQTHNSLQTQEPTNKVPESTLHMQFEGFNSSSKGQCTGYFTAAGATALYIQNVNGQNVNVRLRH
jgi:hypothetical protein